MDEAPYPLIGHEIPLTIKLNWTRQVFNSRGNVGTGGTYDEYKSGGRCTFILRKVGQMPALSTATPTSQKTRLKKVKSSIKLQNVFRRTSKSDVKDEVEAKKKRSSSLISSPTKPGRLFGRPLADVCTLDEDNVHLPKAVEAMLEHIYREGPTTIGIFRRSPNARAMRELRDKLDSCNEKAAEFDDCSVFVTAALLKDFLRSLPDCLLRCEHFKTWLSYSQDCQSHGEAIKRYFAV